MHNEKLNQPQDVKKYYDDWTDRYLDTVGKIFQSYRSTEEDEMFDYYIDVMGIKQQQFVLDAGCGVGGPILALNKKIAANFTGITISPYQIELANKFYSESKNSLKGGTVTFKEGDFHNLSSMFPEESFDHAIFLESFGHSNNPQKLMKEVYTVLKKGGQLYIKDFYRKLSSDAETKAKIDETIANLNKHYCYNKPDLAETLNAIREAGFELLFVRPPHFLADPKIKKAFVKKYNLTGLGYGAIDTYEIKCVKP